MESTRMTNKKTGSELPCQHCGRLVYVPKNRLHSFKYCSRSCLAKASRVSIVASCAVCGDEFNHISSRSNKAKYCSRTCYYKAMTKKGTVQKNCLFCNSVILTSPSADKDFCSNRCKSDYKMLSSHSPASFQTARKWMLARNLLSKCHDCGYDDEPRIIGVHHDDENRSNNHPSNLIPLCPTCHSLRHLKHIPHAPDSHIKST